MKEAVHRDWWRISGAQMCRRAHPDESNIRRSVPAGASLDEPATKLSTQDKIIGALKVTSVDGPIFDARLRPAGSSVTSVP
jgi:hypothetical protein